MSRLTASGADRADACPASFALPAVFAEAGKHADDGTDLHARLERAIVGHELDARGDCRERRDWRELGLPFDPFAALPIGRHESETAWAYDPISDTGRALTNGAHRDYSATEPHEVPMTIDVITTDDAGQVTITDWKTGHRGASVQTLQLVVNALAVARARGLDSVTVAIAHVQGDRVHVTSRTLDAIDLAAAAAQVRGIVERINDARAIVASGRVPDVYPSEDACRYCPCMASCPAHVALARSVLGQTWEPATVATAIEAMSPSEAGELWYRFKAGEDLLEQIGKSLRARCEREALPLPDGRVLRMVAQTQVRPVMVPDPSGAKKTTTFLKATATKVAS